MTTFDPSAAPPAANPSTGPICIAFPTILSGLVLRWYADEAAYRANRELAHAGREDATVFTFRGCPPDVEEAAKDAHALICRAYLAELHPKIDVSRWVTHEAVDFLAREIRPVAR